MPGGMSFEIVGLLVVAGALLLAFIIRPGITRDGGGRILGFLALFLLPAFAFVVGFGAHMEQSKRTQFCLSCHVMKPYGQSLRVDDSEYLPASHFQNNRVTRDDACFTCHTTYAMYGDLKAKLGGLRHIAINYFADIPDTIKLYEPYNNRECLHCHNGSRTFEESDAHAETDTTMIAMKANRLSCLTSGCHDVVHDVRNLGQLEMWKGSHP
jgi:nitrate/TMAO reductase-like tetraheme cytochrome c subunit